MDAQLLDTIAAVVAVIFVFALGYLLGWTARGKRFATPIQSVGVVPDGDPVLVVTYPERWSTEQVTRLREEVRDGFRDWTLTPGNVRAVTFTYQAVKR